MQKSPALSYRPDVTAPLSAGEVDVERNLGRSRHQDGLETGGVATSTPPRYSQASDTSDSDQECEPAKSFLRRISTNRTIRNSPSIKEGYLVKHTTSSFHRSRRRYFKLKGRILYYCKSNKSEIYNEIDLIGSTVAECSSKIVNLSFQVITPTRNFVLSATCRQEMDAWMSALKNSATRDYYEPNLDHLEMTTGRHNWNACSHARPIYCNVCREVLSGVVSHGLSCDVCKFKCHKRCAARASDSCKWTTLSSVGEHIQEEDGIIHMSHQWVEGNLPVSAKCSCCGKACGSVIRLQDYRCLWCKAMVHTGCRDQFTTRCDTGVNRVSVLPPTRITKLDSDGRWCAYAEHGSSPLLVFVNSKSGDNRGIKMLRKFKQILNPAQVFDLMNGGPRIGLRLFQNFESFRVLVAGGDGSIGWVLNEIDQLSLQKQSQVGVLPLGTGNDLARVLGWGAIFDDDAQLPSVLERMEHAQIKMLDRWSIMTFEGHMTTSSSHKTKPCDSSQPARKYTQEAMSIYQDSVVNHLSNILNSDNYYTVISSARVLCETVKGFVARMTIAGAEVDRQKGLGHTQISGTSGQRKPSVAGQCEVLSSKLEALLAALNDESSSTPTSATTSATEGRRDRATSESTALVSPPSDESTAQRRPLSATASNANRRSCYSETRTSVEGMSSSGDDELQEKSRDLKSRMACKETEKPLIEKCNKFDLILPNSDDDVFKDDDNQDNSQQPKENISIAKKRFMKSNDHLVSRANSLKKAFQQLIVHTEQVIDDQNSDTTFYQGLKDFEEPTRIPDINITSAPQSSSPDIQVDDIVLEETGDIPSSTLMSSLTVPSYSSYWASDSDISSLSSSPQLSPHSHSNQNGKASLSDNLTGDSFVGKVLLANADALCAAVSPLIPDEMDMYDYGEHCVMNNYFGIGLDAKITLDFHLRREEHPEKCRSRTRNMMLYGVIGGRAIVRRRWRNLDQRVRLECDGRQIPLPNLQGLVVLNIPSYMGGINFWGNSKSDDNFAAVSFDDKILEVVAVFGGVQLGISRVINFQHHRIAQCRSVKITIIGDQGVPIQVDGEAWVQPPGYIKISHKNRSQMLIRDKVFEEALKVWREKQRVERLYSRDLHDPSSSTSYDPCDLTPPLTSESCLGCSSSGTAAAATTSSGSSRLLDPLNPSDRLSQREMNIITSFVAATQRFINSIKIASAYNSLFSQDLQHLVQQCNCFLSRITDNSTSSPQTQSQSHKSKPDVRKQVSDLVSSVRTLYHETSSCLADKTHTEGLREDVERSLRTLIKVMSSEIMKVYEIGGLPQLMDIELEAKELRRKKHKQKSHFRLVKLKKGNSSTLNKKEKDKDSTRNFNVGRVDEWGTSEVGRWLDFLKLGEDYKTAFLTHDIQGRELMALARQDLKDLGVSKVGHLKRIQQAIKELCRDFDKLQ